MNESLAQWIIEARDMLLKQQNILPAWKELSNETVISKGGDIQADRKRDLVSFGKNPRRYI